MPQFEFGETPTPPGMRGCCGGSQLPRASPDPETAPESLVPTGAGPLLSQRGDGRSCVLQSPAIPKDGDSPPPGDPSQGCSIPRAPEHPKM